MKLIFPVPPEADGALLRNFCAGVPSPPSWPARSSSTAAASGLVDSPSCEPPGRSRAGHLVRTAC